jgi:hypothetical protein
VPKRGRRYSKHYIVLFTMSSQVHAVFEWQDPPTRQGFASKIAG